MQLEVNQYMGGMRHTLKVYLIAFGPSKVGNAPGG